ncbi:MAG: AbrB/MazE/SpoVT family DNA-binding domain-containing protein [Chloroflexi bacterium]|nr:AbrB/MazE/SpoVT family DNA-binding domain-containing protein [Chloroflexota bacterium]
MKETSTTITKKGQVTIPVEIRHSLGLAPGDKVAFVLENNEVKVRPAKSALERSFGAVKPRKSPEDLRELERLAEEAMAEDALRGLKG